MAIHLTMCRRRLSPDLYAEPPDQVLQRTRRKQRAPEHQVGRAIRRSGLYQEENAVSGLEG
jgi:hypothetical protein